jgi:hypothetical protein
MAEFLYAAAAAHGVEAAVTRLSELEGFPAPGTPEDPPPDPGPPVPIPRPPAH